MIDEIPDDLKLIDPPASPTPTPALTRRPPAPTSIDAILRSPFPRVSAPAPSFDPDSGTIQNPNVTPGPAPSNPAAPAAPVSAPAPESAPSAPSAPEPPPPDLQLLNTPDATVPKDLQLISRGGAPEGVPNDLQLVTRAAGPSLTAQTPQTPQGDNDQQAADIAEQTNQDIAAQEAHYGRKLSPQERADVSYAVRGRVLSAGKAGNPGFGAASDSEEQIRQKALGDESGLQNYSGAALQATTQVLPHLTGLFAPTFGKEWEDAIQKNAASKPGSTGARIGGVVGTGINVFESTLLPMPAVAAIGAAEGAGAKRIDIARRREQGQDISGGQEIAATGYTAAINAAASLIGMKIAGKVGSGVARAITTRTIGPAIKATVTGLVGGGAKGFAEKLTQNAVDRFSGIDPKQPLTQGTIDSAINAALGDTLAGYAAGFHQWINSPGTTLGKPRTPGSSNTTGMSEEAAAGVLGLDPKNYTESDVRRAGREAYNKYHEDVVGKENADPVKQQQAKEAYDTLIGKFRGPKPVQGFREAEEAVPTGKTEEAAPAPRRSSKPKPQEQEQERTGPIVTPAPAGAEPGTAEAKAEPKAEPVAKPSETAEPAPKPEPTPAVAKVREAAAEVVKQEGLNSPAVEALRQAEEHLTPPAPVTPSVLQGTVEDETQPDWKLPVHPTVNEGGAWTEHPNTPKIIRSAIQELQDRGVLERGETTKLFLRDAIDRLGGGPQNGERLARFLKQYLDQHQDDIRPPEPPAPPSPDSITPVGEGATKPPVKKELTDDDLPQRPRSGESTPFQPDERLVTKDERDALTAPLDEAPEEQAPEPAPVEGPSFKGVPVNKPGKDLTDEEFAKIVEPDPTAFNKRNADLGKHQGDPRFLTKIKKGEIGYQPNRPDDRQPVRTDFAAVREYLRTGKIPEENQQVQDWADRLKAKDPNFTDKGAIGTAHRLRQVIQGYGYNDSLHPQNKNTRKLFEELTGIKLPSGVAATKAILPPGKPIPLVEKAPAPAAAEPKQLKVGDRIPWKNGPGEIRDIEIVKLTPKVATVRWVGGEQLQKIPREAVEQRLKESSPPAAAGDTIPEETDEQGQQTGPPATVQGARTPEGGPVGEGGAALVAGESAGDGKGAEGSGDVDRGDSGSTGGRGEPVRGDGGERDGRDGGEGDSAEGVHPTEPDAENGPGRDIRGAEPTSPSVSEDAEQPRRQTGAGNYVIPDAAALHTGSLKQKFRDNVNAIETLRKVEAEGRPATLEEQQILSKFVGWGAMPGAFNKYDESAGDWTKERDEINGLLTPEEHAAASASTKNAHFTSGPIVQGMWEMAQRLGFGGRGRVLESSMGIGNFFGLMPPELRKGSNLTGIELDRLTGRMAKLLYPKANVLVQGFEDLKTPHGFFDFSIGNYPFGDYPVHDKAYSAFRGAQIHDYFFLKNVDQVRPGGIIIAITSTGTMDKMNPRIRKALAEKVDLVAAIRLPEGAFQKNAGTAVVTDLIILKRRPETTAGMKGSDWMAQLDAMANKWTDIKTVPDPAGGADIPINEYFVDHPEQVLGTVDRKSRLYSGDAPHVSATPDFEKLWKDAIARLPEGVYQPADKPASVSSTPTIAPDTVKEGAFVKGSGGKMQRRVNGELVDAEVTPEQQKIIEGVMGVRDALRDVINAQVEGKSKEEIDAARKKLNQVYDAFVKKNGPLHTPKNAKVFKDDPDAPVVLALEEWNKQTKTAKKADAFRQNTIRGYEKPTKAGDIGEAMGISLNETATVDLDRIAGLLGKSKLEVGKQLVDRGLAFEDPAEGWQSGEQYLSGNVRRKLGEATEAAKVDPKYKPNVTALKNVQPKDVPYDEIDARLGVPWVGPEDVAGFAAEQFGNIDPETFAIKYIPASGEWLADWADDRYRGTPNDTQILGTNRAPFMDVLEAALNNKVITIRDKVSVDPDQYVVNKEETAGANQKIDELQQRFREWIWQEDNRRHRLHRVYNDTFNNIAPVRYNGSHLNFTGMSPEWAAMFRPHQKNAVWRTIVKGTALYGHEVGSGKTATFVAAGMELRRLGLAKKPGIAVLKSTFPGLVKEAKEIYPGARILAVDKFEAKDRKKIVSQIATGDYDLVILTHDHLDMLPMKRETQAAFIQREIQELTDVITAVESDEPSRGGRRGRGKSSKGNRLVKKLEKAKARLEARLKEALDSKQDDAITFEETGIDHLFVDEAQEYKSLPVYTKQDRVKGIPSGRSDRATQMAMRTRWLQEQHNGRGIVMATGTPITNTMAELYTMQRYLQSKELEERGILAFDAWARNFGIITTKMEYTVAGEYSPVSRFSQFVNLPELGKIAGEVIDIQRAKNLPNFTRPKRKDQVVVVPMTTAQKAYLSDIRRRAVAAKKKRPGEKGDNMLSISSDARKSALDMRLVHAGAEEGDSNKIKAVVENVLKYWREDPTRTQMIFSDIGVHPTEEGYSAFKDITDRLVAAGMPANKIINFSDLTDKERRTAAHRLKTGDALLGMGSTKKMGTGINAQDHLYALHHMDVPWRPGDVEQRDGRGWRQGNRHKEIQVLRYTTEGSFDTFMWQAVDSKDRFIKQFTDSMGKGEDTGARKMVEDDEEELSPAQIMAVTSGNPYLLEKINLDRDVAELQGGARRHERNTLRLKDTAKHLEDLVPQVQGTIDELSADLKTIQAAPDTQGDKFSIKIGGKNYADRDEAATALLDVDASREWKQIGEFRGLPLYVKRAMGSDEQLRLGQGITSKFSINSLEYAARPGTVGADIKAYSQQMAQYQKDAAAARKEAANPFPKADELKKKLEELKQVTAKMGGGPSDPIAAAAKEFLINEGIAHPPDTDHLFPNDQAYISRALQSGWTPSDDMITGAGIENRDEWTKKMTGGGPQLPPPRRGFVLVPDVKGMLGTIRRLRERLSEIEAKDSPALAAGMTRLLTSYDQAESLVRSFQSKVFGRGPDAEKKFQEWLELGYHFRRELMNARGQPATNLPKLSPAEVARRMADPNIKKGIDQWNRDIRPMIDEIRIANGLPMDPNAGTVPFFINLPTEMDASTGGQTAAGFGKSFSKPASGEGEYMNDPAEALTRIIGGHLKTEAQAQVARAVKAISISPTRVSDPAAKRSPATFQRPTKGVPFVAKYKGKITPVGVVDLNEGKMGAGGNPMPPEYHYVPLRVAKELNNLHQNRGEYDTPFDAVMRLATRAALVGDFSPHTQRVLSSVGARLAQSGYSPAGMLPSWMGSTPSAIRRLGQMRRSPIGETMQILVDRSGSNRAQGYGIKPATSLLGKTLNVAHNALMDPEVGIDPLSRRVVADAHLRMHLGNKFMDKLEEQVNTGALTPLAAARHIEQKIGDQEVLALGRRVNNTLGYSNRQTRSNLLNWMQRVDPFISSQSGMIPDEVRRFTTGNVNPKALGKTIKRGEYGRAAMQLAAMLATGAVGVYLLKQGLNLALTKATSGQAKYMDQNTPGHKDDVQIAPEWYWTNLDPGLSRAERITGAAAVQNHETPKPGKEMMNEAFSMLNSGLRTIFSTATGYNLYLTDRGKNGKQEKQTRLMKSDGIESPFGVGRETYRAIKDGKPVAPGLIKDAATSVLGMQLKNQGPSSTPSSAPTMPKMPTAPKMPKI